MISKLISLILFSIAFIPDTTLGTYVCPIQNKACIYCRNGYLSDTFGCPTCNCKPTTTLAPTTTSYKCPPMNKLCIRCPNGYVNDAHGCPTCKCAPASTTTSKPIVCPAIGLICSKCDYGYLNDAHGCPTCNCAPPTKTFKTKTTSKPTIFTCCPTCLCATLPTTLPLS